MPSTRQLSVIGVKAIKLVALGHLVPGACFRVQVGSRNQRKHAPNPTSFPRLNRPEILGPGRAKNPEELLESHPMYKNRSNKCMALQETTAAKSMRTDMISLGITHTSLNAINGHIGDIDEVKERAICCLVEPLQ